MREQEIVKEMQNRYPEAEITIHEVVKVNRTKRGLTIKESGCSIAPTIYLGDFGNMTVEKAGDEIQKIYERYKVNKDFDIAWYSNLEHVKDRLFMKLVNTEWCAEYLEGKPSIPFLDLSIVFYVEVISDEFGQGAITVTNEHMQDWGTDPETLYEMAKANTNPIFMDMSKLLKEMGAPEEECEQMTGMQYVITNTRRRYGAGVLPVALEALKERFGKFYILPSSIHEVICVPAYGVEDKAVLDKMVREVNEMNVEAEERLADHAYYFNGECLEV